MDAETVDREYADLQQKGQQTAALVQALAGKLSSAATSGDTNAREWQLDRKEIALAIRDEESTATSLLQAIHALVDNHVQSAPAAPAFEQPPAYLPPHQPQPGYQPPPTRRRISRPPTRSPAVGYTASWGAPSGSSWGAPSARR